MNNRYYKMKAAFKSRVDTGRHGPKSAGVGLKWQIQHVHASEGIDRKTNCGLDRNICFVKHATQSELRVAVESQASQDRRPLRRSRCLRSCAGLVLYLYRE